MHGAALEAPSETPSETLSETLSGARSETPYVKAPEMTPATAEGDAEVCTTLEVARTLGLAVRSVQLMVDRGELQAWKTPGGHRRIARASVQRWQQARQPTVPVAPMQPVSPARQADAAPAPRRPCVLLIEDSRHTQTLIKLLVQQHFPQVDLQLADDGITGLAMAGQLQPDVLLVDILLPGIDGATLIAGVRSNKAFGRTRLIVVTGLDAEQRQPYAFALQGVPVAYKPRLAIELPVLLAQALALALALALPP